MLSIEEARKQLGATGERLSDKEIEKLQRNLYAFINQILDNHIEIIKLCKKP